MIGTCLCGKVQVEVSSSPAKINICNCKFCRKSGAAWGYYPSVEVAVIGETVGFSRTDLDDVWLVGHFCPSCGTTTHYVSTEQHPSDKVGVNMRLFDQNELAGIAVHFLDGRDVETDDDEFEVTAIGHVGDGRAF